MKVLLNSFQWPCAIYMYHVVHSDQVIIEAEENFQKQTYRNRFRILSANGPLDLSVPILHHAPKMLMKEIQIDNSSRWQQQHWGAIKSAYGNSPYFDFFADDIASLYAVRQESLVDFNQGQLEMVLKILRIIKEITFTRQYEDSYQDNHEILDLRNLAHPKQDNWQKGPAGQVCLQPYQQTFSEKFPFVANLSILDLIFNLGLDTKNYFGL